MTLSLGSALFLTRALAAFAIALQTLELLALRRHFADDGLWAWPVLRRDFEAWPRPLRASLDAVLSARGFFALLFARLVLASMAPLFAWTWPALFVLSVLVVMRFRGSFGGGSDTMTLVIASALGAHALFSADDFGTVVCLAYIALHATLSYFVAGLVKVRSSLWRSGGALRHFLVASAYPVPPAVRAFAGQRPGLVRAATYGVLAFELAFPIVFVRAATLPMLALAFVFHLANFAVFGLNRFVWAWLAAYPAIAFFGDRFARLSD